ncbi:MAG: hypothetical protein H2174_07330 [Vampirovibrio sp.]|nr:hypothetical protein [Vampirovibrio sp.]
MYEKSFEKILELEGGVSDHPNDRGGLTHFGITQETYGIYQKNVK